MSPDLLLRLAALTLLTGGLLLIPFGFPGLWFMVLVVLGAVLAGWVGWTTWIVLLVASGVAEILEWVVLSRTATRIGATRKAFWGAVVGGFIGVFVGMPVPVVGPLVAGFVGTFLGAGVVTWAETRSLGDASRVGWGVLVARVVAVGVKVGTGVAVLVVGGGALFF